MGEKGRERCWRASLYSLLHYSDSMLPDMALVSALAGCKELAWTLDGCTATGNWGIILVPSFSPLTSAAPALGCKTR